MKKKWILFILLSILGTIVICGGCERKDRQKGSSKLSEANAATANIARTEDSPSEAPSFSKEGEVLTVRHDMGTAEVPLHPQKIAVLDLGLLDTLLAFQDGFAYIMPYYGCLPTHLADIRPQLYVGNPKEPDFNKIRDFAPDVIFIGARMTSHYDQLSELAPVVYTRTGITTRRFVEEMHFTTRLMASLFGKETDAEVIIQEQNKRMEQLCRENQRKKHTALLIATSERGLLSFDDMSLYAFLYQDMGFSCPLPSSPQDSHGGPTTQKDILELDVDYIFVFDREEAVGRESVTTRKAYETLRKELEKKGVRVVPVDSPTWYLCQNGVGGFDRILSEVEDALS